MSHLGDGCLQNALAVDSEFQVQVFHYKNKPHII